MLNKSTRRSLTSACIFCGLLLAHGLLINDASATPLNLTSTHPGDVTTHFTNVVYTLDANPATGTLTATGFPDEFDVNSQGFNTSDFTLTLSIARATGQPLGGTVVINGDTDGTPHYNGLLLQGNIVQFGFVNAPLGSPAAGNNFEFVVAVTGGLLAAPYYSSGFAGIIMNIANTTAPVQFTGVFTSAFHNNGHSAFSDTFPITNPNVPEPSSFLLLALGIAPLAWRWRRTRSRIA